MKKINRFQIIIATILVGGSFVTPLADTHGTTLLSAATVVNSMGQGSSMSIPVTLNGTVSATLRLQGGGGVVYSKAAMAKVQAIRP